MSRSGSGEWKFEGLRSATGNRGALCRKMRAQGIGGVEVARSAICAQADPPGRKDPNGKRTPWWCRGKRNDPANACVNARRVGRSAYFGAGPSGSCCFKRRWPETVSPKCLVRWCCGRPARVAACIRFRAEEKKGGGSGLSPFRTSTHRLAQRDADRREGPASRAAEPYPEPRGQFPESSVLVNPSLRSRGRGRGW
jgi:hypothetical protein